MIEIKEYFKKLRFDNDHHLGLGDIRLTISQQEEIIELVKKLINQNKDERDSNI